MKKPIEIKIKYTVDQRIDYWTEQSALAVERLAYWKSKFERAKFRLDKALAEKNKGLYGYTEIEKAEERLNRTIAKVKKA